MNKKKPRGIKDADIELAIWIAEQGAVRLSTLGRKLEIKNRNIDSRQVRRIGQRLVAKDLANKEKILEGSAILWPTHKSLALAGLVGANAPRNKRPSLSTLLHSIEVAEVRVVYEANGATWICERKIREHFPDHLPDGLAYYDETPIIVEVDRTRKNKLRFKKILETNLTSLGRNNVVDYWIPEDLFVFASAQRELLPVGVRENFRVFIIPQEAL